MKLLAWLKALLSPIVCTRCGYIWTTEKVGSGDAAITCPCCHYARR